MKTVSLTILLLASLFLPAVSPMNAAPDDGDRPYAIVTMKDRSEIKLEFDSVAIPWVDTEVRDEFSCTATRFHIDDVQEVIILNEAWNPCTQRDEWLFDVYFSDDRPPLRGFMTILQPRLSGRFFQAGPLPAGQALPDAAARERLFPFEAVDKVSFHRRAR